MTKEQVNHYNRDVSVQEFVGENPGQYPSGEVYTMDKEIFDTQIIVLQNLLKMQANLELGLLLY
jgi:hypothetical protein